MRLPDVHLATFGRIDSAFIGNSHKGKGGGTEFSHGGTITEEDKSYIIQHNF
jgi:hypothetical protein